MGAVVSLFDWYFQTHPNVASDFRRGGYTNVDGLGDWIINKANIRVKDMGVSENRLNPIVPNGE